MSMWSKIGVISWAATFIYLMIDNRNFYTLVVGEFIKKQSWKVLIATGAYLVFFGWLLLWMTAFMGPLMIPVCLVGLVSNWFIGHDLLEGIYEERIKKMEEEVTYVKVK